MVKIKKNMRVLVVGMGRTGVAATKLLCKKGCKVTVTDELNKTDLMESIEALEGYKYKAELGKHVLKTFCDQDLIVVSPGVSLDIKPLRQAERSKIPIISEVELASLFINKPIVAITGTNGKTTTSTLIAEMIRAVGKTAFLCGNVGLPISDYVSKRDRSDFIVLEISSFQLETTHTLKPAVSVILNLAPDHLDRYSSYDDYIEAKMRLVKNQTEDDHVVTNLRDPKLMSLLSNVKPKVMYFTTDTLSKVPVQYTERFQGMYLSPPTVMHLHAPRWKEHEFDLNNLLLRGLHNKENVMAAALAAKLVGVSNEAIQKVITTFEPLPHRMEFVARKNQVNFYNDSKGTNVHSLMRSLESFREPVILIAGGKDKGEEYEVLEHSIRNHVKNLILVGEAKEKINRAVGDFAETFLVGTFEEAVYLAYQKARSGDVILLSPGCASQDMFKNFEERGDRYKALINMFP
ncbi:MAG: UDP-N-acetylmuramoyl-L-alanine--D-glutamate ligase [Bdellovibrionales bacterium]|nr:UDP-N-acetylmuramoyl-L-alanine--D-glutamate ligase [Bdellovibrionales bacterium]